MKKNSFARTAVGMALAALGGAAWAQSSVTMFGVVDVNVAYYQANSKFRYDPGAPGLGYTPATLKKSQWALSRSGESINRLGFRGTEDLGGGLAASFWLEAELLPDEGAVGDPFFSRRSTVSLSGPFGEVRLGRDFTPTFWNEAVFDPFSSTGVGATLTLSPTWGGLHDNTGYPSQSNTVSYFLPANLGGFYGQVQYAFHENISYSPGDTTPADAKTRTGRYLGGRLGYANGPLDVALVYATRVVDDDYYSGSTVRGKIWSLGGSYDFGMVKLFGQYAQVNRKPMLINEDYSRKATTYLLGAAMPVGVGVIKASYSRMNGSGGNLQYGKPSTDKFALGYVHHLSKRTALYATGAYFKDKNGMGAGVGLYQPAGTVGYDLPFPTIPGYGTYLPNKSYGYEFGIRHAF